MPAIFHYEHVVRADEIDDHGHVNNLAYLRWLQSAAIAHSAAQGWTGDRYRQSGGGWVVRSHFVEYLQPAFLGQSIIVRTWVATFGKITSLRRYEVRRAGEEALLVRAETNWAFVSLVTFAPRRIPADVTSAFEIVPDA